MRTLDNKDTRPPLRAGIANAIPISMFLIQLIMLGSNKEYQLIFTIKVNILPIIYFIQRGIQGSGQKRGVAPLSEFERK